jgi:ADP-ribose pyrophosphatase YjhB (NUDIX family)
MERFQLLVTVNILLIKDNKMLLARRANTGFYDGCYECPSGHIDGNESVRKAAARELLEEVKDLKVVHVVHRYGEKKERVEFYLVAEKWEGEPSIKEVDKCDDVAWFSLDQFPENMVPKTKAAIDSYLAGEIYSEFDWK